MEPFLTDHDLDLYVGDCRDVLRGLDAESVHCVVTSPPYWSLRDYGTGKWEGGDPGCDHTRPPGGTGGDPRYGANKGNAGGAPTPMGKACVYCGAVRVDRQLGLERTPQEYVDNMVDVFREVHRVLRNDGTLFLNLGDSYIGGGKGPGGSDKQSSNHGANIPGASRTVPGLKQKDLAGIPWRVALALQEPYYTGKIKDERDRIWLAAMVEAEGCMFIHKRGVGQYASSFTKQDGTESHYHRKNATYSAGLEISSTDRVIVQRCMEIAGIGSVCEQSPDQNARRKQTIYRWNARSNKCRDVIRELYPHFIAKQHEARLLLGCPSSGEDARKAHESLNAIHQGLKPCIDFAAPEGMWERGWFLRSDIIWAKLEPTPCPRVSRTVRLVRTNTCSC